MALAQQGEVAGLLEELAEVHLQMLPVREQSEEALRLYERSLRRYGEAGDRAGELRTLARLVEIYTLQVLFEKAQPYARRRQTLLAEGGDRVGELQVLLQRANLLLAQDDLAGAETAWREWRATRPAASSSAGGEMSLARLEEAAFLEHLAELYTGRSETGRAVRLYRTALNLRRALGDRSRLKMYLGLAEAFLARGEVGLAREYSALAFNTLSGQVFALTRPQAVEFANFASELPSKGYNRLAFSIYSQLLPFFRTIEDKQSEAATLTGIGRVYSALGEPQKALDYYKQALPLQRAVEDRRGEAATLTGIGLVYLDLGEPQKALDYYEQALPLRRAVEDRFGEIATCKGFARVYEDLDELDKSISYQGRAVELAAEVGHYELKDYVTRLDQLKLKRAAQIEAEAAPLKEVYVPPEEDEGANPVPGAEGAIHQQESREEGGAEMGLAKAHALLVGVGRYKHHPELKAMVTAQDAVALAEVLADPRRAGYGNVQRLTEQTATSKGILDALGDLADCTDDESLVFLFFASHGETASDEEGGYYFLTHESRRVGGRWQPETLLSGRQLREAIRRIKARKLLVVFQTCHSGVMTAEALAAADGAGAGADETATGQALSAEAQAELVESGAGRYVISACREGQLSWFYQTEENTFFVRRLLQGLRGDVPGLNKRGYIGLFELFEYVSEGLAEDIRLKINSVPKYSTVKQEPALTVLQGVGAFPVALYRGEGAGNLETGGWAEVERGLKGEVEGGRGYVQVVQVGRDYREGDRAGRDIHKTGDTLSGNAMKFGDGNTYNGPVGPNARQTNQGPGSRYHEYNNSNVGNSGGINMTGQAGVGSVSYGGGGAEPSGNPTRPGGLPPELEGLFTALHNVITVESEKARRETALVAAQHLKDEVSRVWADPTTRPNPYVVEGTLRDLREAGPGVASIVSLILSQPSIAAAFKPYLDKFNP